jgi:hypothetical protein
MVKRKPHLDSIEMLQVRILVELETRSRKWKVAIYYRQTIQTPVKTKPSCCYASPPKSKFGHDSVFFSSGANHVQTSHNLVSD